MPGILLGEAQSQLCFSVLADRLQMRLILIDRISRREREIILIRPFFERARCQRERCRLLTKRVLFICTGNVDRSPTAEALLREKQGFEVKSAGTWTGARTVVSKELIDWADMIFVMEERHKEALKQIDKRADMKIVVLGIDDHYLKGDPELERILKEKLSRYLDKI